jgi:integration host factor subunit beta
MSKSELIGRIINKFTILPAGEVKYGIYKILEYISEALSKSERIEVRGFGNFSLHYYLQRNVCNPRTGEKLISKPKYAVHFKPGKQMRERVNDARLRNVGIIQE